jgi:hypothetical protein
MLSALNATITTDERLQEPQPGLRRPGGLA